MLKGFLKREKGITLIALIITIIVLLILAGVSIAMLAGENGILNQATRAKESTIIGQEKEQIELAYGAALINKLGENITESELQDELDKIIPDETVVSENADGTFNIFYINTENSYTLDNGQVTEKQPITNPYEGEEWVMAWTYTNGTWSDTIYSGNEANGDIVAKLYATGNQITPEGFTFIGTGQTFTFNTGDEYILVIEGEGNMGALMTTNGTTITSASAWHLSTVQYMLGYTDTCIMPYVSEVIICDGITNIGAYAFAGDTSLTTITMTDDIEQIGEFTFLYNINLSNIELSAKLTSIGQSAFFQCLKLESITIPSNVNNIGDSIFYGCSNLITIRILAKDESLLTISNNAFSTESSNYVTIYVKNEEIKELLESLNLSSNIIVIVE